MSRALRVWTRAEIAATAVRMAREVTPHHGRCPCARCRCVRSVRGAIQQAAEPAPTPGEDR